MNGLLFIFIVVVIIIARVESNDSKLGRLSSTQLHPKHYTIVSIQL